MKACATSIAAKVQSKCDAIDNTIIIASVLGVGELIPKLRAVPPEALPVEKSLITIRDLTPSPLATVTQRLEITLKVSPFFFMSSENFSNLLCGIKSPA